MYAIFEFGAVFILNFVPHWREHIGHNCAV